MPEIGIGPIWVVVALLVGGLFVFLGRRSAANERLKREGIPGTAQVLEVEQTGTYVNRQPQVKLRLRVEARGMAPYEVEKRVTVPMIAMGTLSSGRPLNVAVDPNDRDRIAIDWGGSGAAPAMLTPQGGQPIDLNANPAAREAAMQAMRDHGVNPSGQVDLRSNPEAARRCWRRWQARDRRRPRPGGGDPATPVASEPKGEPLDRMTKLMQLRAANLITDEELQEYRRRVLEDV